MKQTLSLILILIFTWTINPKLNGQVEKIKVKKTNNENQFKNDSCDYSVKIQKEILNKNLTISSIITDSGPNNFEVVQNEKYKKTFYFLEKKKNITYFEIKTMFIEFCKINQFKLKEIEVKKHETNNANYQNRVDIYLTYSK